MSFPIRFVICAKVSCIVLGFVAGNDHNVREKLVAYCKSYSTFVFIPFFTLVGLSLNLPVLINTIAFAVTASMVRAFCMFLGTICGGKMSQIEPDKSARLWMGLLPQAGVSLGLASIIGHEYSDTFGPSFQSTMIGK